MISKWSQINTNEVLGILCDLDNTLYEYDSCNAAGIQACREIVFSEYGIQPMEFDQIWKKSRESIHLQLPDFAAGHSRLLYAQKFSEIYFGVTNSKFSLQLEDIYWNTFLEQMTWISEAETFLLNASESGKRICIITDLTTQIQMRKWEKLEIGRFANFLVSSEEAGLEKPSNVIFNLALDKMGLKPDQVIMIGDSEKKDIQGAKSLGIKAYLV